MKNVILTLVAILIASFSFAQGGGFNYKALITDNGNVLANHSVTFKFTVLENGTTSVYQETQTATTDANGIVAVNIGEGAVVSGDFDTIDWGGNPYFLKVEIDTGSGYQNFGTTEFKAVPYAKYADNAGNTFSGNFGDLSNIPAGLTDGDDVNDADHDATNELQDLSLSGTQLSISNGNDVNFTGWDTDASDDFSGDYNDLTNSPILFYEGVGTTPATNSSQDISRTGSICVGYDFTSAISGALFRANSRPSGNDDTYGFGAAIGGTGDGDQYGAKIQVLNSGNGLHFGIATSLTSNGSGNHYGINNYLSGSGDGTIYGTRNFLINTGNGSHYGYYSRIEGHGSSWQVGYGTWIYGDASGNNYGVRNLLTGTGSGDKYGTYSYINPTAGGTHYAVYGEAEKAGSYAGYFKGDVYASKKLKGHDSGDTDMKAYIYGSIASSGSFSVNGSHSDGFSVSKTATGVYEITFTGTNKPTDANQYTVIANMRFNSIGFITVRNYDTYFTIKTYNTSGTAANKAFNFVVYKK